MINKETERKIRKLLSTSEPVLDWVKEELDNDGLRDSILFTYTIQSLTLIKEIGQDLLADDSEVSSKKFTQKKLF